MRGAREDGSALLITAHLGGTPAGPKTSGRVRSGRTFLFVVASELRRYRRAMEGREACVRTRVREYTRTCEVRARVVVVVVVVSDLQPSPPTAAS